MSKEFTFVPEPSTSEQAGKDLVIKHARTAMESNPPFLIVQEGFNEGIGTLDALLARWYTTPDSFTPEFSSGEEPFDSFASDRGDASVLKSRAVLLGDKQHSEISRDPDNPDIVLAFSMSVAARDNQETDEFLRMLAKPNEPDASLRRKSDALRYSSLTIDAAQRYLQESGEPRITQGTGVKFILHHHGFSWHNAALFHPVGTGVMSQEVSLLVPSLDIAKMQAAALQFQSPR